MMVPNLTHVAELKQVLRKAKVSPDKRMGQNFLISPEVVDATLAVLEDGPKRVTELGPGVGTLTQALAGAGYTVRAIEKDDDFVRLIPSLIPKRARDDVTVVHDDLREADWTQEQPYQLVGNIPYNLSGLIFRTLVQLDPAPEQAVFLVQQEVGDRLTATPPEMSLLSLAVGLWGSAQRVLTVPAHCFWPQPKVHSALVLLLPHTDNPFSATERESVLSFAKPFFQAKRKQIGGMLRKAYKLDADEARTVLRECDIQATIRPQELSVDQWNTLHESFTKLSDHKKEGGAS